MRKKITTPRNAAPRTAKRPNPPVQIRVTDQALRMIDTAAEAAGRSRSAEVSARLEGTFRPQMEPTLALTEPLAAALEIIGQYLGDWREDRFAYEVLAIIAKTLLERQQPMGDPVPRPNEVSGGDLFFSAEDTPAVAAKTVIGMALADAPLRARKT